MRKNQGTRLKDLAEKVGWVGELSALAEFTNRAVVCMPEVVGTAMRQYYLESADVPRREDGKYNIYFYQILEKGRAALIALSNVSPEVVQLAAKSREDGMWNAA